MATFADPIRAQSAIDRLANKTYDFVIEGKSYRGRLKPKLAPATPSKSGQKKAS